jgi:hypothetical protein
VGPAKPLLSIQFVHDSRQIIAYVPNGLCLRVASDDHRCAIRHGGVEIGTLTRSLESKLIPLTETQKRLNWFATFRIISKSTSSMIKFNFYIFCRNWSIRKKYSDNRN